MAKKIIYKGEALLATTKFVFRELKRKPTRHPVCIL